MNNKREKELIVVSSVWPSGNMGGAIAAKSGLNQFVKTFSKIYFFGPLEEKFIERDDWTGMNISWLSLPLARPPKWVQFLKSLCSRWPAVVMRFRGAAAPFLQELDQIVHSARQRDCDLVIIYENLQPSYLLPIVKRHYPEISQAVRDHDPYVKGFENIDREGPLLKRLAWRIELRKMRWFEMEIFHKATAFWTITQDDLDMYQRRLGIKPDGVLGVCMDANRYQSVAQGASEIVVHVGTADLRKGKGLRDFIATVWPLVRAEIPEARLIVAGRNTERLTDPRQGVEGMGFVRDDREVLAKGTIFVNPQQTGAGIKLKKRRRHACGQGAGFHTRRD